MKKTGGCSGKLLVTSQRISVGLGTRALLGPPKNTMEMMPAALGPAVGAAVLPFAGLVAGIAGTASWYWQFELSPEWLGRIVCQLMFDSATLFGVWC